MYVIKFGINAREREELVTKARGVTDSTGGA
jgi:hypothetical protein